MTVLILSIIGLVFGVVVQAVLLHFAFPFIWLVTFIAPAEVINTLFFCLKFYLTGGLFHYVFDGKLNPEWSFQIIDIMKSPIEYEFLIVFGFSTFFLIYQISNNFVKKFFQHNWHVNYVRPNYLYLFLFFLSIIFVPVIFALLNFSVMLFIDGIDYFFKLSQPISSESFANFYLNGQGQFLQSKWHSWSELQTQINELKTQIPESDDITKLFESLEKIISKEKYKDFSSEYNSFLDNLKLNVPQPSRDFILKNIGSFNDFLERKIGVINSFTSQLDGLNQMIYPEMKWKEKGDYEKVIRIIKEIREKLIWNENFLVHDHDENFQYIDSESISATKQLFIIYSHKVFNDDLWWTNWHFGIQYWPGVVPITNYTNYVLVTLTGFVMANCVSSFIRLMILMVSQFFRSIYLLIISPFILAKSLDDDGFSFRQWWKEISNNYFLIIVILFFFIASSKIIGKVSEQIHVKDDYAPPENMRYIYAGLIGSLITSCFACSSWFGNWIVNLVHNKEKERFATSSEAQSIVNAGGGTSGGAHPSQSSEFIKSMSTGLIKDTRSIVKDFSQWRKDRVTRKTKI